MTTHTFNTYTYNELQTQKAKDNALDVYFERIAANYLDQYIREYCSDIKERYSGTDSEFVGVDSVKVSQDDRGSITGNLEVTIDFEFDIENDIERIIKFLHSRNLNLSESQKNLHDRFAKFFSDYCRFNSSIYTSNHCTDDFIRWFGEFEHAFNKFLIYNSRYNAQFNSHYEWSENIKFDDFQFNCSDKIVISNMIREEQEFVNSLENLWTYSNIKSIFKLYMDTVEDDLHDYVQPLNEYITNFDSRSNLELWLLDNEDSIEFTEDGKKLYII